MRAPALQPTSRDPLVVDLRHRLEEVDRAPDRDNRLRHSLPLRDESLLGGARSRLGLGHRDREHDHSARREPGRRHEQLGSVSTRPVEIDRRRERALPGWDREHPVDPAAARHRERDVMHGDRVPLVDHAPVDCTGAAPSCRRRTGVPPPCHSSPHTRGWSRSRPRGWRRRLSSRSRGGRIRTDETSRPQNGRSTRLSYTPYTFVRSNSMTVCTDKLALRDLVHDGTPRAPVHESTHFESLGLAREVIPVHRSVVEVAAAVRARSRFLERRCQDSSSAWRSLRKCTRVWRVFRQ